MKDYLATIYEAADDKKGAQIRVLDISKISVIADYFIIVTGFNINQVQAIADNIEDQMLLKHTIHPIRVEGYNTGSWILIDFGNIVVHVFGESERHFYDLDRIWCDAAEIQLGA